MQASKTDFTGFPYDSVTFLRDLSSNNNRTWFRANQDRYQRLLIDPAKAFVEALAERLREVSAEIQAEPRINGSIFRINRDIRFSKDKTPYKTHLDLWFWEGPDRSWTSSGFFFRLSTEKLLLGAGMHDFDAPTLAAYREAVVDPTEGAGLVQAIKRVQSAGPYELGGLHYKRIPKGYDPEHERADLLKHKGLYCGVEGPIPSNLYTRKLVDYCLAHYRNCAPLHEWLVRMTKRAR